MLLSATCAHLALQRANRNVLPTETPRVNCYVCLNHSESSLCCCLFIFPRDVYIFQRVFERACHQHMPTTICSTPHADRHAAHQVAISSSSDTSASTVAGATNNDRRQHGTAMIVAWVCLTPIGIFTARNMRGVLNNPVGLWFKIHMILQVRRWSPACLSLWYRLLLPNCKMPSPHHAKIQQQLLLLE
jgi:hypothetical protein